MEIKDKPNSMSVREWITKKIALETNISEKIIKLVVSHNYDAAYEALDKFNSIEIAGFGKFYYNEKYADREREKCLQQKATFQEAFDKATTEKKRHSYRKRLETVEKKLLNLKNKQNGNNEGNS